MLDQHFLENFSFHYPNMRISRFSLKAGEKIPLHIHRNQFGLAYLLYGKCLVKTYEVEKIDEEQLLLTLNAQQELSTHSYCVITPKINAHQIHALEDSTFLDVFAPGLAEEKLSDYLDIIKSEKNGLRLTAKKMSIEDVELPVSLLKNMDSYTKISNE